MLGKSILFSLFFLGLDIAIYFSIYFFTTLALKGFPVLEVAKVGGMFVIARIIYFQAIVQFIFIIIVRYCNLQANIVIVLFTCVLAFFLSSLYFLKDISSFLNYFTISFTHKDIGPGLVLMTSVVLAWLVFFKVTKISEGL